MVNRSENRKIMSEKRLLCKTMRGIISEEYIQTNSGKDSTKHDCWHAVYVIYAEVA